MNPWKTLEIEPTNDKTIIKKAYAKVIKRYHPEDDPQGFMMARKAYETALSMADDILYKDNSHTSSNGVDLNDRDIYDEDDYQYDEDEDDYEYGDDEEEYDYEEYIEESEDAPQEIYNKLNEIEALYKDFFRRNDVKEWEKIFHNLSIAEHQQLGYRIPSFFYENFYLPKEVWKYLDEEFSLCSNLSYRHDEWINQDFGLEYDYFKPSISCDYDQYVKLRYSAAVFLREKKFEDALKETIDAISIFNMDPCTYRIMGIAYYKLKDYQNSIEAFAKALELNPEDTDYRVKRGYSYLKASQYRLANKDFEMVLKCEPSHSEANKGLIMGYVGLNLKEIAGDLRKKFYDNGEERDIELDLLFQDNDKFEVINKDKPFQKTIKIIIRFIILSIVFLLFFVFEKYWLGAFILLMSYFVKKALFKSRKLWSP